MRNGLLVAISLLIAWQSTNAQARSKGPEYVDYHSYLSGISEVYLRQLPDRRGKAAGTNPLESEVMSAPVALLRARSKKMAPESIFAMRKQSVFVLGMLDTRVKDSVLQVRLSGASTAFAIGEQGVCVTNYHVLKGLIHPDSGHSAIYFIATNEKEVFFIEEILGYSRNNDIAVFRVNTNGKRLKPVPVGKPACVGAQVYCISHPNSNFYYFSAGMVTRNVLVPENDVINGYDPGGRTPIRMEVSADYAVGSSGGPVFDQCGNLIGIISATAAIGPFKSKPGEGVSGHQQMVLKKAVPVKALRDLVDE